MSVFMSLRVKGDADKLEQMARDNPAMFQQVTDRAKQRGCIHHRFAAADGDVIVMDEWESEDAFRGFFDDSPEIAEMMREAGVTEQPQISFYRPLQMGDEF